MNLDPKTYNLGDKSKTGSIFLIIGIIFLGLSAIGYFQDSAHFFLNYLTGFFFWLTIALGGLFFVMLHHITGARWSTVLRKITEAIASTLPLMAILFIPVLFGLHDLFHWAHEDAVMTDEILKGKSGYLNTPFFLIRMVVYFIVWIGLAYLLKKVSSDQDKGHTPDITKRMKKISAPGIVLFALTITFASFDWMMSLDAHWFSTIFGVYIFSGSFLAFLCFLVLVIKWLRSNHKLKEFITVEHYHDIGKMTFGFIIFWAYMAFSQYFLIWYANIPEETYWFLYRWDNSWEIVSNIIIFGHFVFPFLALITRASKRSVAFLSFMSIWLLIMHFVDLYWIALPTHNQEGVHLSLFDFAPLIGIGGIFIWFLIRNLSRSTLVPIMDPTLEDSKNFLNG